MTNMPPADPSSQGMTAAHEQKEHLMRTSHGNRRPPKGHSKHNMPPASGRKRNTDQGLPTTTPPLPCKQSIPASQWGGSLFWSHGRALSLPPPPHAPVGGYPTLDQSPLASSPPSSRLQHRMGRAKGDPKGTRQRPPPPQMRRCRRRVVRCGLPTGGRLPDRAVRRHKASHRAAGACDNRTEASRRRRRRRGTSRGRKGMRGNPTAAGGCSQRQKRRGVPPAPRLPPIPAPVLRALCQCHPGRVKDTRKPQRDGRRTSSAKTTARHFPCHVSALLCPPRRPRTRTPSYRRDAPGSAQHVAYENRARAARKTTTTTTPLLPTAPLPTVQLEKTYPHPQRILLPRLSGGRHHRRRRRHSTDLVPLPQQPHPLLVPHAVVAAALTTTSPLTAAQAASRRRRSTARGRTVEGLATSGGRGGSHRHGPTASVRVGGGEQGGPRHGRDSRPGGGVAGKLSLRVSASGGDKVRKARGLFGGSDKGSGGRPHVEGGEGSGEGRGGGGCTSGRLHARPVRVTEQRHHAEGGGCATVGAPLPRKLPFTPVCLCCRRRCCPPPKGQRPAAARGRRRVRSAGGGGRGGLFSRRSLGRRRLPGGVGGGRPCHRHRRQGAQATSRTHRGARDGSGGGGPAVCRRRRYLKPPAHRRSGGSGGQQRRRRSAGRRAGMCTRRRREWGGASGGVSGGGGGGDGRRGGGSAVSRGATPLDAPRGMTYGRRRGRRGEGWQRRRR